MLYTRCPNCSAEHFLEDVNLEGREIECRDCASVFAVEVMPTPIGFAYFDLKARLGREAAKSREEQRARLGRAKSSSPQGERPMILTRCPYCSAEQLLEDDKLAGQESRCRGCSVFFRVQPLPMSTGLARDDLLARLRQQDWQKLAQASTTLVDHHICTQCKKPIHQSTGRTRCTIPCPSCQQRTSLYSVIFRCRHCGGSLEAAERLIDRATSCPLCGKEVQVPRDATSPTAAPRQIETGFLVTCPNSSCGRKIEADRALVGTRLVCPTCSWEFLVPRHGESPTGSSSTTTRHAGVAPGEVLHSKKQIHCRNCATLIPLGLKTCNYCGARC